MATWIGFEAAGLSLSGKTRVWRVYTTYDGGGVTLGEIRWHGAWRKYAFFPAPQTLFEPTCLRDIAGFIDRQMAERRKAERERRVERETRAMYGGLR